MTKKLTNGQEATDNDRRLAHDAEVGFFVASDGRPYPSKGAVAWGLAEVDRVTGPDAVGNRIAGNGTTACPRCGSPSLLEPGDTVDIGVGEMTIGPDGWHCPACGPWWIPEFGEPACFASDTPPYVPPDTASETP